MSDSPGFFKYIFAAQFLKPQIGSGQAEKKIGQWIFEHIGEVGLAISAPIIYIEVRLDVYLTDAGLDEVIAVITDRLRAQGIKATVALAHIEQGATQNDEETPTINLGAGAGEAAQAPDAEELFGT